MLSLYWDCTWFLSWNDASWGIRLNCVSAAWWICFCFQSGRLICVFHLPAQMNSQSHISIWPVYSQNPSFPWSGNVINNLLMMHIGHLTLLTESINKKLLVIKIVERSRSLKSKNYFWLYQIKDGIGEILKFGHRGIEDYLQIRRHQPYKQLKLNV